MAWCEWLETARKSPSSPHIMRLLKRSLELATVFENFFFLNFSGELFQTCGILCLEKALLMAAERRSSLLSLRRCPPPVNISASRFPQCFLLCCPLWGFPSFQFFTSCAKNKSKPKKPTSVPTISPVHPQQTNFEVRSVELMEIL